MASDDTGGEASSEEIIVEFDTDVEFEGQKGTVYAVQTVRQGDRRTDWKVGHVDGSYAEAFDHYYKGELFESNELVKITENGPLGKYKDDRFYPLLDSDYSQGDGEMTESKTYDTEGIDASEWAVGYMDGNFMPETILDEFWEEAKSDYDEDL